MWIYIFFLEEWTIYLTFDVGKRPHIIHQVFPDGDIYEINHYKWFWYKPKFRNWLILFLIFAMPSLALFAIIFSLDWIYDDEEDELYWWHVSRINIINADEDIPANILRSLNEEEKSFTTEISSIYFLRLNTDYLEKYINMYIKYLAVIFEVGMEETGEYFEDDLVISSIINYDYYLFYLLKGSIDGKVFGHENYEENFKEENDLWKL